MKHQFLLLLPILLLSFFILSYLSYNTFGFEPFETNNRSILAECERYKSAASDVIERSRQLDDREDSIVKKEEELQELRNSLERQLQLVSDESKANSSLSTDLTNSKQDVETAQETIRQLQNKIRDMESSKRNSSSEAKQKEQRIKQMESKINSVDKAYSQQLKNLERERQALGEQRISLQDTQANLESAYGLRSSNFQKKSSL